jgi:ribosomal-protein-serine acetyltransferase
VNFAQMLSLRYPEPEDAPAVLAAVRASIEVLHAWMAWCRLDFSLADASVWIGQQPEARLTGTAFEFLVCDTSGELVGVCGVNQINKDYRYGNLGYWVRSSRAGQGMATLAARQVAEWAFETTDLERLEIVVATGNIASQRVAEKLGSVREGVLRSRLLIHGAFHDAVMNSLIRPRGTA